MVTCQSGVDRTLNRYKRPQFIRDGIPDEWIPAKEVPKVLNFKEGLIGIEIGTCYGASTFHFLEMLPNSRVIAIDPYSDEGYDQMATRVPAYESFQKLMELYPNRITLIRKTSDDAVSEIEDNLIDFVFIDGFHSNEQVKKDIENYYPKLKSGGLMSGHDYNGWALQSSVNEMAEYYEKKVQFCEQDVWYFFKD